MADAVDDDTEAAVVALAKATPAVMALLPDGVQSGRLKSPRPAVYAQVASELHGEAERFAVAGSTPVRIDRRKVTLKIWGVRSDAVAAGKAALAVFNDRLGAPNNPTLTYPSGARFTRWLPLNDGVLSEDPDTKSGLDVWVISIEAEVRSVRTG